MIPRPNLTHLATYICVYMCVRVCRCVCVCAHMCVSLYIHIHTHTCMGAHTHVCIHVCVYIQLILSRIVWKKLLICIKMDLALITYNGWRAMLNQTKLKQFTKTHLTMLADLTILLLHSAQGASDGVMIRAVDSQTLMSVFNSHWVRHLCGFVPLLVSFSHQL